VTGLEIGPLTAEESGSYVELLRAVWGETAMTEEERRWWFDGNPNGRGVVSVARDGGELLGTAAHSVFRWRIAGKERLVTYSVHAAVRPGARGRFVFPSLESVNAQAATELGAEAAFAFPNPASGRILVRRHGYTAFPPLRAWARVKSPAAPLRHLRGRPGPMATLKEPKADARRYRSVRVVPLTRFGAVTDEAYARASAGWGNHLVRRADHLNWRYLDAPWGYRAFASLRVGEVSGWVVLRVKRHAGAALAVIADLVAPPGAFAETRALLRRSLAEVRRADAAIVLPPRDRAQRAALLSLGFLPAPLTVDFMGRPLVDGLRLDPSPEAWSISLGDTDFF
jgi:hypothetical protein